MENTEQIVEKGTVESAVNSLLTPVEEAPVEQVDENQAEEQLDAVDDTAVEESVEETTEEEVVSDDQNEDAPEEFFTVQVDGEAEEWTLDDLKRSASGQGKIQKNMQQTATIRKQAEETYQALQNERTNLQKTLEQYQSRFANDTLTKPSIELLETDPIQYQIDKARYDEAMEQRQTLGVERQRQAQAQEAQTKQAMSVYMAEQAKLLAEKIPEFGEPDKANVLKTELVSAGQTYGYTADEISQIVDARAVQVLHDANKWRKLQASKGKVETKVSKARPIVKSGSKQVASSNNFKRTQQVNSQFKKTGSVADATLAILQGGS